MKRISKDEYYLNIAREVSKRSTCLKRHYGCVIVNEDIIVATGYNGSPRGAENCCDRGYCKRAKEARYSNYEECDSVHAEQNALMATSRDRLIGATLYLACEESKIFILHGDMRHIGDKVSPEYDGTDDENSIVWIEDESPVPCNICSRMIRNSGITRVVNRMGDINLGK